MIYASTPLMHTHNATNGNGVIRLSQAKNTFLSRYELEVFLYPVMKL